MNLYLFLFPIISCTSFLKENYEVIQGIYHIMLKIESVNLINYMEIDLSIGFLWISDLNFEEEDLVSTSLISTETVQLSNGIMYLAKLLKGRVTLDFNEISMSDFYMYYLKREEYKIYDSVGLAFHVDNPKYSFIHQLYNHRYIDKLLFAFVPNKRFYNSGEIFYGGLPEEKIKDKYITHCSVSDHWGCSLQGMKIGNKLYEFNEKYIHFETQYQKIFLHKNIFDIIVKNYLNEYIQKQQCYMNNERYFCTCSYIDSFSNMSFILDEHEFIFTAHELFEQEGLNCYFIIQENTKTYYDIFGTYFLRKYITIFDYENKTISFYDDEPFTEQNSNKGDGSIIVKMVYLFISISLLINTIIILYINKKYIY